MSTHKMLTGQLIILFVCLFISLCLSLPPPPLPRVLLNTFFFNKDILVTRTPSWQQCQELCCIESYCELWSFNRYFCHLKTNGATSQSIFGSTSGFKYCPKTEAVEVDDNSSAIDNNPATHTECCTPGKIRETEVLILGAGMSGVTAALRLKEAGVTDIMVVEGADRIGGRVKEVEFGGVTVEVGANWVQFGKMEADYFNAVEHMVRDAKLEFVSDNYEDYIFRFKGEDVTNEADDVYERLKLALNSSINLARKKRAKRQPDVNFRVGLALGDWRPVSPVESAVEFHNFDFEFGDEPSDTGLKENFEVFSKHGKDDMFVKDKRGFSQIVRNEAQDIPLVEGTNLFLNNRVTEIRREEPGPYPIVVTAKDTQSGESITYRAKWAIMTFSIGVLESDLVKFVPKLPAWKEEVIYMFKMVRYIKIFVKFPSNVEPFWDDNHYIIYVDPHTRGRYQMWQNLEARGKYFPRGTNILLCTVIGNNWERVDSLSKEQIKDELFNVLKDMYGSKAIRPEDILVPDWHHNPLFFGSYSNWPIGVTDEVYKNMDAPVGRLYMAGEHCGRQLNGYVTGAQESGNRTAMELYRCMKGESCEQVPSEGYGYSEEQCLTSSS